MGKKKKNNAMGSVMKDMTGMFAAGATGAGMQIGLGAMAATPGIPAGAVASIGNASAGITNITAQFPTMGTLSGMKPLFKVTKDLGDLI